jgi:hypothetical protein
VFYGSVKHPSFPSREGDRVEPMDRIRRLTADHMVRAKRVAPHVHSFIEIDFTQIDRVRGASKSKWEQQGAKVSYTAFVAWAVAHIMHQFPMVNATISGDSIVYRRDVNVGIVNIVVLNFICTFLVLDKSGRSRAAVMTGTVLARLSVSLAFAGARLNIIGRRAAIGTPRASGASKTTRTRWTPAHSGVRIGAGSTERSSHGRQTRGSSARHGSSPAARRRHSPCARRVSGR